MHPKMDMLTAIDLRFNRLNTTKKILIFALKHNTGTVGKKMSRKNITTACVMKR